VKSNAIVVVFKGTIVAKEDKGRQKRGRKGTDNRQAQAQFHGYATSDTLGQVCTAYRAQADLVPWHETAPKKSFRGKNSEVKTAGTARRQIKSNRQVSEEAEGGPKTKKERGKGKEKKGTGKRGSGSLINIGVEEKRGKEKKV